MIKNNESKDSKHTHSIMESVNNPKRHFEKMILYTIQQRISILKLKKYKLDIPSFLVPVSFAKTQDEFLVKAEKSLNTLLDFDSCILFLVNKSVQGIYSLPYIGNDSQNQIIKVLNELAPKEKQIKPKSKSKLAKIKIKEPISSTFIKLAKMPFNVGITGQCLNEQRYIICEDIKGTSSFSQDIDNFKGLTQVNNLIVVPFYSCINKDTPIGIIQCINTKSRRTISQFQIDVANALRGFLSSCVDNIDTFEISLFKIKIAIEGCNKVLPDLK